MTDSAAEFRDVQRPLEEGMPPAVAASAAPALRPAVPGGERPGSDEAVRVPAPMARTATEPITAITDDATGTSPSDRARRILRAVLVAPWRGLRRVMAWSRRVMAWSRRPSGRLVVPSTLVLTLLAASAVAGAVLVPRPVTGEA